MHHQRQQTTRRKQSRPFPWGRLIIALIVSVILAFLALLLILSTGNIIPTYWAYILPPIFVFAGLLLPLLQWLFPLSSEDATDQPTYPTTLESVIPTQDMSYQPHRFVSGPTQETVNIFLRNTPHSEKTAKLTQPQAGRNPIKLFISYRRKSWPFVHLLVEKLKVQIKCDIFVDYTGIDDTDFESSILRHLRESDIVLVVVTELTFTSERIHNDNDWVRHEIALALKLKKPIVLIRVDNLLLPPPSELPKDIRDITRMQGIAFYPEYFDAAVEKLAVFVMKVLASTTTSKKRFSPVQANPTVITQSTTEQWVKEGTALYNLKQYGEAIDAYDQAIRFDSTNARAYYSKGTALNHLERYGEAIDAYDQAIRLDPTDAGSYNNKGFTLAHLKQYGEAIDAYDQAIRFDSTNARFYSNKSYTLIELKRYEEAIAACDQAIRLDSTNACAYNNKGCALIELKRYGEAIDAYDQAIRLDPTNARFYSNKGRALNRLKRYEEAVATYDQAIHLDPTNTLAYYKKGYILNSLKQHEEAIVVYDQAIHLNPNDAPAYNGKGNALYDLQRYEQALLIYEQALRLDPNYASVYNNMGNTLKRLGKDREAQQAYERAKQFDTKVKGVS